MIWIDLFEDFIRFSKEKTKKILLVEDNEMDSSQIAKILGGDHMNISLAQNGSRAIECLQNESYDCIIMDYSLPDISGHDLIRTGK